MGIDGFCGGMQLKRQRVFRFRRFPRRVEQKSFRTAGIVRTAGIIGKFGGAEHLVGAEIGQLLHQQIQADRNSTFQKSRVFLHRVFVQGAEESIDERRFGAVDHVLPIKIDHHFGELSNLAELFERNHLKHVDPITLVIKVKRIGANVNDDGARSRFSDQIEQNGE